MSISAKGSLSIRKQDLKTQRTTAVGFKSLRFWHKATAGDTGIDLSNLVFPSTELPNESNPTSAEIASAKLLFNKSNVEVKSSIRGVLLQTSYSIPHNSRISFEGFTAQAGEIFEVTVRNKAETGLRTVDASSVVATGTLSAGQTDFAVGTPFELKKYPNEQIGAVLVYLDGILQYRNVGNATASPSADGNYEEVDSGDGRTSNLIRFNNTSVSDREVTVISNGLLVSQPDDSRDAALNSLATSVDIMIDDLAVATGNPATKYQGAPSNVDLKQFGNRVFNIEKAINTYEILVQEVYVTDSTPTVITSSAIIPFDNTIPQNTEGELIVQASFTPKFSDSRLVIDGLGIHGTTRTGGDNLVTTLVRTDQANALTSVFEFTEADRASSNNISYQEDVSTFGTSTVTLQIRGMGNAGPVTWFKNSASSPTTLGGNLTSWIRIREYRTITL